MHGVTISKTCAEIVTYCVTYYMSMMVKLTRACDFDVIHGVTDSIFIKVKKEMGQEHNISADFIKSKITQATTLDAKGLAIVKNDSIKAAKYALGMVMKALHDDESQENTTRTLVDIVGRVISAIQQGLTDDMWMVSETRVSGQPHHVYVDENGSLQKIQVEIGLKPRHNACKTINTKTLPIVIKKYQRFSITSIFNKPVTAAASNYDVIPPQTSPNSQIMKCAQVYTQMGPLTAHTQHRGHRSHVSLRG
ncbi:hypothetical protein CkaCkLH20_01999 [Colletotrichum karsti]|uniref:Uncharacterized protein n=1 Tax=Colletotrichum karsti TaxID=1095194 RepID=A0A9P6IEK6_9PEZI|nr:uncharacterized protein CkaCkLH20_01999 [Colletotrichum karsti]KAF9880957.1 hypothetical protein CkaCkLH20_01999 [Colletotrichum karsti]